MAKEVLKSSPSTKQVLALRLASWHRGRFQTPENSGSNPPPVIGNYTEECIGNNKLKEAENGPFEINACDLALCR